MDLEKALLEEAQYAVSDLKNRARALEPQLEEIKKLKLEIEAECQAGPSHPSVCLNTRLRSERNISAPAAGSPTSAGLRFTPPALRAPTEASCAAKPVPPNLSFPRSEIAARGRRASWDRCAMKDRARYLVDALRMDSRRSARRFNPHSVASAAALCQLGFRLRSTGSGAVLSIVAMVR